MTKDERRVQYPDSISKPTGAFIYVDQSHSAMHDGRHYFIKGVLINVEVDTVLYFMFKTPDSDVRVHANAKFHANAGFNIKIFEGAVLTDYGIPILGINNNRDSDREAHLHPYAYPDVSDEGIQIWESQIRGEASAGVSPTLGYEIIVKRNSIYLHKIVKLKDKNVPPSLNDNYIDYDFWWYELSHKKYKYTD